MRVVPEWLQPIVELAESNTLDGDRDDEAWRNRSVGGNGERAVAQDEEGRPSAVLILFGEGPDGPDVLLIERAHTLRFHAAQPAFPGGRIDPGDNGPIDAALRETVEETGVDTNGVHVIGTLPALFLAPSRYLVTPVLGWWHTSSDVSVVDPAEVASVHRVPIADLLDPRNRFRVRHPSGFIGPAFGVVGLTVWGFTGGLLDRIFRSAGWERPWDRNRVEELPEHLVEFSSRPQ